MPERINERLRAVLSNKNLTIKELSKVTGVTTRSIQNYLSGERTISTDLLIALNEQLGISSDWVLTGKGTMEKSSYVSSPQDSLVRIPEYDVSFSAGNGNYGSTYTPTVGERPFDPTWLAKKGLKPSNLSLVRVQGDSMEPLLKDKDIIMVDSSKTIPNDASPFAVRVEESLYIKIIQKRKNVLTLFSINSAYQPITVNLEEDDCQIIGSVVWHAHSWI